MGPQVSHRRWCPISIIFYGESLNSEFPVVSEHPLNIYAINELALQTVVMALIVVNVTESKHILLTA